MKCPECRKEIEAINKITVTIDNINAEHSCCDDCFIDYITLVNVLDEVFQLNQEYSKGRRNETSM